jgi:neutral amino acid transport system substrate-binding protein
MSTRRGGTLGAWTVAVVVLATALAGCAGRGDDGQTLRLGVMMPLTGPLSPLGPGMENGAKLAIKDINDANVGFRIIPNYQDDKTVGTADAPNTFNLLVNQFGATAIIGPCCSGVLTAVLDLAVQNEVVVATPSGTNPDMTKARDNQGYFWRTPPNDIFQGAVLAELVASDNVTFANMIIINNPYGVALADQFKQAFEQRGGKVNRTERYDETATSYASQVDNACAEPRPQAIVLVSYVDEGAGILREMQNKACRSGMRVYGPEGIQDAALVEKAGKDNEDRWLAAGVKGTAPRVPSDAYKSKYEAEYGRQPTLYSDYSYDTVMYVALAAVKAESVRGSAIKDQLRATANSPGQKVSDFAQAVQLIRNGQEIDWVGFGHDFEFDQLNEPAQGIFQWWTVNEQGQIVTLRAAIEA